jgi:hypothetical protein
MQWYPLTPVPFPLTLPVVFALVPVAVLLLPVPTAVAPGPQAKLLVDPVAVAPWVEAAPSMQTNCARAGVALKNCSHPKRQRAQRNKTDSRAVPRTTGFKRAAFVAGVNFVPGKWLPMPAR